MTMLIETERAFDEIKTHFHGKKNNLKLGIEGNFCNLIKNIKEKKKKKPTGNIILNGERLNTFPLILKTR